MPLPDVEALVRKNDEDIVDLVKRLEREDAEAEMVMKAGISDSVQKWCSKLPIAHKQRIAHIALNFLRRIDSTICFLVAAYRMLAKAP